MEPEPEEAAGAARATAVPAADRVPVDQALRRAAEVLTSAQRVALAGHVNPDPDALGSMLGLAAFLRERGVEVVCSWPNDPVEHPAWLSFFRDLPTIVGPREFPKAPEVMVALDTASPDRLASLLPNAGAAGCLVVLVQASAGRYQDAFAALDRGKQPVARDLALRAYIHALSGNRTEALRLLAVLEQLSRREYVPPAEVAPVHRLVSV